MGSFVCEHLEDHSLGPTVQKQAIQNIVLQLYLEATWRLKISHLIPGVGSIGWVNEDSDDFCLGNQRSCSFRGFLRMEIIGALLKEKVRGDVGWCRKEFHVPTQRIGS